MGQIHHQLKSKKREAARCAASLFLGLVVAKPEKRGAALRPAPLFSGFKKAQSAVITKKDMIYLTPYG
ncbi:hypothetical protein HCU40_12295 [Pseudanabaena biceps]|nr:hypothetical protein [Pseudanabaena biceps]